MRNPARLHHVLRMIAVAAILVSACGKKKESSDKSKAEPAGKETALSSPHPRARRSTVQSNATSRGLPHSSGVYARVGVSNAGRMVD